MNIVWDRETAWQRLKALEEEQNQAQAQQVDKRGQFM